MNPNLIFDIGMHKCEDSEFYLKQGYQVVAVDADRELVDAAKTKYQKYVEQGTFTILNYAVAEEDDLEVKFHISENTLWSSLNANISERTHPSARTVEVKTRKLGSLFEEYGVPTYCKIDIEGHDNVCLQSLTPSRPLPEFMSVESECVGEQENATEEKALDTLYSLKELGYRRFKLIDQRTLNVLDPNRKFYYKKTRLEKRVRRYIRKIVPLQARHFYTKRFKHHFPYGATGPFGNDTKGKWLGYKDAINNLKRHRDAYYRLENAVDYGFWCDWHAAL